MDCDFTYVPLVLAKTLNDDCHTHAPLPCRADGTPPAQLCDPGLDTVLAIAHVLHGGLGDSKCAARAVRWPLRLFWRPF
jgi:hypothetical protein